jgi:hypothetical protein
VLSFLNGGIELLNPGEAGARFQVEVPHENQGKEANLGS